jgi:flavin-dependent dehydrogenase
VERKAYPFHKVCGEYVSNEVLPWLQSIGCGPEELHPAAISKLLVSSPSGKSLKHNLDLGGFGISRYALDDFLYKKAEEKGAKFILGHKATDVKYSQDSFIASIERNPDIQARVVIGSYGKRANLDKTLDRPFFKKRSPYIGVKYHIRGAFPEDEISLHNFKDGYCGLNPIEDDKYCLCYLSSRDNLKKYGSIPEMEKEVLCKNPALKHIFLNAEFLYDKPEVINEISFLKKETVTGHILMGGDAAGMIAPLCGNGMAMAIHSAKILSETVVNYFLRHHDRERLEKEYTTGWNTQFSARLKAGRLIQKLFGNEMLSEIAVGGLRFLPSATNWIMKRTHGEEVKI